MGDIAEGMLEGILCMECGTFMEDSEEKPFAHSCPDCLNGE